MIRKVVPSDLPKIRRLWRQTAFFTHPELPLAFWSRHPPAVVRPWAGGLRGFVFEVDDSGDIAGFVSLDRFDHLDAVVIEAPARGQGMGSQLIRCAKLGRPRLTAGILERNLAGRYFLQKHGFVERDRHPCAGAGQLQLLMECGGRI